MNINRVEGIYSAPVLYKSIKTNNKRVSEVSFKAKLQSFENKKSALEYYKEKGIRVNRSLENGNIETAFKALKYNVSSGYFNMVKIDGNYKPYFIYMDLQTNNPRSVTYEEAGIDEDMLMSNVACITGTVTKLNKVDDNFKINPGGYYPLPMLERLDEVLKKRALEVNKALREGDSEKALNILGYKTSKDESGRIIIEGDYSHKLIRTNDLYREQAKTLSDYNIDENALLKNVIAIKGNMEFSDKFYTPLDKDFSLEGLVLTPLISHSQKKSVFSNFYSSQEVGEKCGNLSDMTIENYAYKQILKPAMITGQLYYNNQFVAKYFYFAKNEETEGFIEDIKSNREHLLTCKEMKKKLDIGKYVIRNMWGEGKLREYKVPDGKSIDYEYALFDINDEKNMLALNKLISKRLVKGAENVTKKELEEASLRNSLKVKGENSSIHDFPVSALEGLGYGRKQDIIAQYKFSKSIYKFMEFLTGQNNIDVSTASMMVLLDQTRSENPEVIKLTDLKKPLGDKYSEFIQAILDDKIRVTTTDAVRLTDMSKYYINIFNEQNIQYFKGVESKSFQKWLTEREKQLTEYRKENDEIFAKLKAMTKMSETERGKAVEEFIKSEIQKAKAKKAEEAKKAKLIKAQNTSLATAIAWTLSPNTREAWRKRFSPTIREIFERNAEAKKLHNDLLKGEITYEEAKALIKKLNITEEERIIIFGFYKGVWEEAGTEEFSSGRNKAKEFVEIYRTEGIDAIQDEKVRARIKLWEEKHNIK